MRIFSKHNLLAIGIICLLVVSSGCSFVPGKSSAAELIPGWLQETVEIHLPRYPAETHPPLIGWQVHFIQGGQAKSQEIGAGNTSVHLTLDKNQPTAVLFYPLTQLQGQPTSFFRPAGCIYPYNRTASWMEGFAAEIFFQLARSKSQEELISSPLSRFNWPRLTQQVHKVSQKEEDKDVVFSPWFLREELLKTAILQGTTSTRSIRTHSITELPLEEIVMEKQPPGHEGNASGTQNKIYYRYIPLEPIPLKHLSDGSHTLAAPLRKGYILHGENAFLIGSKIFTLFARKNQKPVLVTTGIERYTGRQ